MPIVFDVKIAICLIFAAATLACHSTSGRRVCMPPLLSRACTRLSLPRSPKSPSWISAGRFVMENGKGRDVKELGRERKQMGRKSRRDWKDGAGVKKVVIKIIT